MSSPYATSLTSPRLLSEATMRTRIHRFLVDSIAFAYQVDHDELLAVVPPHLRPRTHRPPMDLPHAPRPSLLCPEERYDMLLLADLVRKVGDKVARHQTSLITDDERDIIMRRILIPARDLGVMEGYVLKLLRLYSVHKGIDHRQAGLHTRGWLWGWSVVADESFEKRLVSDDLLIKAISDTQDMRFVLGNALAEMGDKHLRTRGYSVYESKSYWVDHYSYALCKAVKLGWDSIY